MSHLSRPTKDALLKLAKARREEVITCVLSHGPMAVDAALYGFAVDVLSLDAPVPALSDQEIKEKAREFLDNLPDAVWGELVNVGSDDLVAFVRSLRPLPPHYTA